MPCVSADGKPTKSGLSLLNALKDGVLSPEEVSSKSSLHLFRVRSGLRELKNAGFVVLVDEKYSLTDAGKKVLQ